MIPYYVNFTDAIDRSIGLLTRIGKEVDTGRWQGIPTEGKPDLITLETLDISFRVSMDQDFKEQIRPNLPWADDHFEERVSRVPSNPGEQYKNWPWWNPTIEDATRATDISEPFQFTHTYQERFWPKEAWLDKHAEYHPTFARRERQGIRYDYGDLDDVVNLLLRDPYSRQAYLPIFFPEDTGAVHSGRIPCTLGYHFLLRNSQLHLWYEIRSCDAVRHFRDDVYLACRLALWMIEECQERDQRRAVENEGPSSLWWDVRPGILTFSAHSFHVHKGDLHLLYP